MIRVSDERGRGDALLSPDIQRTAITDYCQRSGYVIAGWVEAVDESGSKARSGWWRRLDETIEQVEAGEVDVIVAWKFSRIARRRRRWAVAVDRVEAAGGRLESATEPNERTATGRFARGMLAELAAFESERIGESWKEVHARRVVSGRPANGKPRWGYTYDRDAKIHRPDPVTGPVLAEVYRRYVAGESVYSLVRSLNNAGMRTSEGYSRGGPAPWSERSLRRAMDSGFAAGMLLVGGTHRSGVHDALIDAETWEAYQAARARRRVVRGAERSQYLLSGLVRCSCGSTMTAGQFGDGHAPKYRCVAAREGRHAGGYVMANYVERAVLDWVHSVADEAKAGTNASAVAAAAARARQATDADILRREAAAVDAELVELSRQVLRKVIPEAAFVVLRDELEARKKHLESEALQMGVQARREPPVQVARELLDVWELLRVPERREALRGLLLHVVVEPGRPRARITPVPIWE